MAALLALSAAALCVGGCRGTAPRVPVAGAEAAVEDAQRQAPPAVRAAGHLAALTAAWPENPQAAAAALALLQTTVAGEGGPLAATLNPRQRFELAAVAFEMRLAEGALAEAQNLLAALAPTDARQASTAAWLRARWLARNGAHRAAAETLMRMFERAPPDPAAVAAAIWRQASRVSRFGLDRLARAGPSASVRGWAAAARDTNAALTPAARAKAWRRWLAQHPNHAAAEFPPAALGVGAPRRIAVMIPLSGELAALGTAIRDGLLTAYLHAAPPDQEPDQGRDQELLFFDTGALTVRDAYQRAVAAQAEVIIGPLNKAAVATLAQLSPRLPVVALNTVEPPVPGAANLMALALAVEDQAAAVAKALIEDGAERVVLFLTDSAWAARARDRLQREARLAVEVTGPLQGVATITERTASALDINGSIARHAELQALLARKLAFTPRRRDDVDAVVAFVTERELLALKPALDFHFAGDLPVYVWSRLPREALAGQLDGVRVFDIPWRLHPDALRDAALAAFEPQRADSPLFALGVDGYRVANQLSRLTTHGESIAGSTGVLTLASDGRLRRTLARAEAIGEVLRPLPNR